MSEIRDEVLEDLLGIKGMTPDMLKALFTHPNIAIVDREAELPTPEYMFLDGHSDTHYITQNAFASDVSKKTQRKMLKAGWLKEVK